MSLIARVRRMEIIFLMISFWKYDKTNLNVVKHGDYCATYHYGNYTLSIAAPSVLKYFESLFLYVAMVYSSMKNQSIN